MSDVQSFRKVVAIALGCIVIIHVLVVGILIFFPKLYRGNSPVARFYAYFVHLGPFYREESIRLSPHVVIVTSNDTIDLVTEFHSRYHEQPWRINQLSLRDKARRIADKLAKGTHKNEVRQSLMLLARKAGGHLPEDSLAIHYFHRWYDLKEKKYVDITVYHSKLPSE